MQAPTQAQIYAGIRYASTWVVTAGAVVVTIGMLPPDTAHAIVDASQRLLVDLKQTIGDSYVLAGLLFPIIAGILAKIGWSSASLKKQIAVVQASPQAQVTVTDPKLAEGIPGVKVEVKAAPL